MSKLPQNGEPITIAVTRGHRVESCHKAWAVVVDADGRVVHGWGDLDTPVFARSALKPIQALPLVLSRAMDHYRLDARHLALASASHNGEAQHVDIVVEWLGRLGLPVSSLECGATLPIDPDAAQALMLSGQGAGPQYNNCSGKHCGFLSVAQHLGMKTNGYIGYDHGVQGMVRECLSHLLGRSAAALDWGVDGCGIPAYAIPLTELATAFARFAEPSRLTAELGLAVTAIFKAMVDHPYLVGGRHRFDTDAMTRLSGLAMIKSGAEGVCAASVPSLGLGIVTKVVDGGRRASDVAMSAVLYHIGILKDDHWQALKSYTEPDVLNVAGLKVGHIHAGGDCC